MERQMRYTVLKDKDIFKYLTDDEQKLLTMICRKINGGRLNSGRGEMKCVVVEHDWPEYEPTWAAIAKRVDGKDRNDMPMFSNVYCSNCGREFGPGDHGFSHCENHKHLTGRL